MLVIQSREVKVIGQATAFGAQNLRPRSRLQPQHTIFEFISCQSRKLHTRCGGSDATKAIINSMMEKAAYPPFASPIH